MLVVATHIRLAISSRHSESERKSWLIVWWNYNSFRSGKNMPDFTSVIKAAVTEQTRGKVFRIEYFHFWPSQSVQALIMNLLSVFLWFVCLLAANAYDPDDKEIEKIISEPGTFEAFYPRETNGMMNSVARASHNHGSFFQHRNPGLKIEQFNFSFIVHSNILALVDIKNSAAYGFRFDGKRRFNFD